MKNLLVLTSSLLLCFSAFAAKPFITQWNTANPGASCSSCVKISLSHCFEYDFDVDWDNDGKWDDLHVTEDITHDYGKPGIYTIAIRGDFGGIYFASIDKSKDPEKIIDIVQWGDIEWGSQQGSAFSGCKNLKISAKDVPDLRDVSCMMSFFKHCEVLNADLSKWNVSGICDMRYMFFGAKKFNQPLSSWDVSSVTKMAWMFSRAIEFNQPIGNWNVSKVEDMTGMFSSAVAFNQPIGDWSVINVTNMRSMFAAATSFNQDLSYWNVIGVTNMERMFASADSYDHPLNNWDVRNVTTMNRMFSHADNFNQPLSKWDVSNVTDMRWMFANTDFFNQALGMWDVSNVTNMESMFKSAEVFNRSINSWDVSAVEDMHDMFFFARRFNQPLDNWNVSNVENMLSMFYRATAFNQSLEKWSFNVNVELPRLLDGCGMDCQSYSSTLIGWAENDFTPANMEIGVEKLLYGTKGAEARTFLIEEKGWTFWRDAESQDELCNQRKATIEEEDKNTIVLYPNPAATELFVYGFEEANYTIYDAHGKVRMRGNMTAGIVDLSELPTGIYFISVSNTETHYKGSFLKN
ncbi:MAG: BspA family leucine-rich repeat surface protein [Bacteroidia bacterium]